MDWEFPVLCTIGMALVGAGVLFGRDWMRKRTDAGLASLPPGMVISIWVIGVVVFWSCVAVLIISFLMYRF